MATRFSRCAAALLVLVPMALLGLTAGGCLGQSGNSPWCAARHHCLCRTNFADRIRAEVLRTDGVRAELLVLEPPEDAEKHPTLQVGMVIGGELSGCETPPVHAPGDVVWVFNYSRGVHDSTECPELKACAAAADCCWEECSESTREACSAYSDQAARNGYLTLAVESGGAYDLGGDPTGPGVIAIDHANSLVDVETCDAEFPPPPEKPCNDTPWF